jgi:hypothetical protein
VRTDTGMTPGPGRYQWYLGTNSIAGATNRFLVLTNVTTIQSGSYKVVVSNAVGPTESQPASLNVIPGLAVKMIPDVFVNGDIGSHYRIDFINAIGDTNAWQTLATVLVTNQPQQFFDVSAIDQPRRFYRALRVP